MADKDFEFEDLKSNSTKKLSEQSSDLDPWSLEALNLSEESESRDIYSKTETDDNAKKEKSKHQKDVKLVTNNRTGVGIFLKKFSGVGKVLLSLFLVFIIVSTIVFGSVGIYIFAFMDPDIDYNLNNLKLQYTSIVYAQDPDTKEYYELTTFHGEQNRIWVDYVDMSSYLPDAIVSIEDKRFYDHEGVDWKRTIGAIINELTNIWGSSQGGSTITQQLVKNLTGDNERDAMRKAREIVRATQLEKEYHKSVIMECYINTVHFGNGCDGVQTAAQFYFGKDAIDLTLLESAALAATIRTPGAENPLDGPEENKERRELCLSLMLEEGFITREEYDAALKDTITLACKQGESAEDNQDDDTPYKVYTWFEEALMDQVEKDLVEQLGWSEERASNALFSEGLRIYSTYNKKIQASLDETFNNNSYFVKDYSGEHCQAAQTIMDYRGHILAMAGGRGEKTANRGLNRATDSTRQPGSSIKPLAVYSPAIEFNKLTYSSHIHDFHVKVAGGGYYPAASGSGSYVTTQRAIQSSLNCPAVRMANELSPEKCFDFLSERYHISSLVKNRVVEGVSLSDQTLSAMALGGMVDGLTVTEVTAAYATFGNGGVYWKPTTYTVIYDTFGNKLLEQEENGEQVISADTANVMCELLQTVVNYGTGTGARFGSWPLMGKTGTTDNTHDSWFACGSPYYVSAVWTGYDSSKDLPGGSSPSIRVWRPTMSKIHSDLSLCDFNVSPGVGYRKYCTASGGLATANCPETSWGYYKESYLPVCNSHGGKILDAGTYPSPVGGKYVDLPKIEKPDPEDAQKSIDAQKKAALKAQEEKKNKE